jgi:hypothetical protein
MPRRRRRADDRDESTVVQNPSLLASKARALRVARKLEREGRPRVSGGTDPGPSGFAWNELKRTEDSN